MNTIAPNQLLTLLLLLFSSTSTGRCLFASDRVPAEVEPDKIEIVVDSQIEPYRGGHFKALLDLGKLPVKRQIKVSAEIQNPYDKRFDFDTIRPGCKCVHASASSSTIEPNGKISLEFIVETPAKVEGILQTIGVTFSKHGDSLTSLHVILSYDLEGVLSFSKKMVTVKGGPELKHIVWRVPFLMTHPCELANIKSRGTGNFAGKLVTSIIGDNGEYFVQCELPTEGLTTGGLAGEVEIHDPTMDRSDTILCVAQLEPEVEMAPSTLHLKYQKEKDAYIGSYLLKFRKGVLEGAENLTEGAPVSIKCSLLAEKGTRPDISVIGKAKRLADNVYRVQLTAVLVSESDFQNAPSAYEVGLKTAAGTKSWESRAKLVFSRF